MQKKIVLVIYSVFAYEYFIHSKVSGNKNTFAAYEIVILSQNFAML